MTIFFTYDDFLMHNTYSIDCSFLINNTRCIDYVFLLIL